MTEEEREPFPTEDPRRKGASNQNNEERPEGDGAGRRPDSGPSPDAPDTAKDEDSPPSAATGNPRAAGG